MTKKSRAYRFQKSPCILENRVSYYHGVNNHDMTRKKNLVFDNRMKDARMVEWLVREMRNSFRVNTFRLIKVLTFLKYK
jgi:hypothetical protein